MSLKIVSDQGPEFKRTRRCSKLRLVSDRPRPIVTYHGIHGENFGTHQMMRMNAALDLYYHNRDEQIAALSARLEELERKR